MDEERDAVDVDESPELLHGGRRCGGTQLLIARDARIASDSETSIDDQVTAWLARLFPLVSQDAPSLATALAPWICDALFSKHSVQGYGRDIAQLLRQMHEHGIGPLAVAADHVRLYKAALLKAGLRPTTTARKL